MKIIFKKAVKILYVITFILFSAQLLSCSQIQYVTETVPNEGLDSEIFDFVVEISNGKDKIEPTQFLNSSSSFVSQEGDNIVARFADYVGLYGYDMKTNLAETPSLSQSSTMSLIVSDTISVGDVQVYDSEATFIKSWSSWEEATNLDEGQYFICISVHNEIEPYYVNATYLFVLNVD